MTLTFPTGWTLLALACYRTRRGLMVLAFSDLYARCQRPFAVIE